MQRMRECPQSEQSMDRVKWTTFIRCYSRSHPPTEWTLKALRCRDRMNFAHFTLSIDCPLRGHSRIFCIVIPFHGNHHQIAYTLNTLQPTSPPQPTTSLKPVIYALIVFLHNIDYFEYSQLRHRSKGRLLNNKHMQLHATSLLIVHLLVIA